MRLLGIVVIGGPFMEVVGDIERRRIRPCIFKVDHDNLRITGMEGGKSMDVLVNKGTRSYLTMLRSSLFRFLAPQQISILCIIMREHALAGAMLGFPLVYPLHISLPFLDKLIKRQFALVRRGDRR